VERKHASPWRILALPKVTVMSDFLQAFKKTEKGREGPFQEKHIRAQLLGETKMHSTQ
jgi:hypothetical protein